MILRSGTANDVGHANVFDSLFRQTTIGIGNRSLIRCRPMANYQYRCPSCRSVYTLEGSIHDDMPEMRPCPRCNFNGSKRDFSFNHTPSMPEHFNHSLGRFVSNNRQFEDGLKQQSAEMSERMGMTVDLQPLSPSEMAEASSHGVTEEGLYESQKAAHDSMAQ